MQICYSCTTSSNTLSNTTILTQKFVAMKLIHLTLFCVCFHIASLVSAASNGSERKTYIVYMGELPRSSVSLSDIHHNLLAEAVGDETISRNLKIHSYGRSFNGFAARLLPHEAALLSQKEGVVSVFENTVQKLLTTRSWDFLGMPLRVKRNKFVESNTIVALLDTGIWVENPSFNDQGYGPPPEKWKGKCERGVNFTGCNNKVIGAQYFNLAGGADPNSVTPLDTDGHGTHTASTAAGAVVDGVSLYGIAEGTARGGVPSARLASYKVCWGIGCQDVDLLAAFDAAIADGADIISVSIGGASRIFTEDPIAIGSFHAAKRGILTVCAGGNSGPFLETVQNVAPWILTVAASTMDRKFQTDVKLGNGETISGISVNTFSPKKDFYPLTSGARAQKTGNVSGNSSACDYDTMSEELVRGNIIFCRGAGGDATIQELGGVGTIMSYDQLEDTAFSALTPASYVSLSDGQKIDEYVNSTKSARAVIYKTKTVPISAPAVASFSSRGPQYLNINILKPDLAAPGVDILAAYTIYNSLSGQYGDDRIVKYNVNSGTSMACPHTSGAAAYVKTFHPEWSPAAIKSALMTTSKSMKIRSMEGELASGTGQINPRRALNPGLVYDIDTISYISFLCKEGYTSKEIALITGDKKYNCSSVPHVQGADGLNYPSFHLQVNASQIDVSAVFYRVVTNVGWGKKIYRVRVKVPNGLIVKVTPSILVFNKTYQKKAFKVMVKAKFLKKNSWLLRGSVVWSSTDRHNVKSPILVYRRS